MGKPQADAPCQSAAVYAIIPSMKYIKTLAFATLAATSLCATTLAADETAATNAPTKKSLKVLMIGNSFSICVLRQMPTCVASVPGLELDLCSMYVGGRPLRDHWRDYEIAATNAAFRPYRINWNYHGVTDSTAPIAKHIVFDKSGKAHANIHDLLSADRWDIITIQQASGESWRPETYLPYGENLLREIRRVAPQAKVYVQETWSYTPFDGRLAKWGIDQNEMYNRLRAAYAKFAAQFNLPIIPTGAAVQDFRKAMPSPDGITGDPCGQPKGKDKFHLNREGEYLQACVWMAKLYDFDVTKLTYRPKFLTEERAVQMRKSAMNAVHAH